YGLEARCDRSAAGVPSNSSAYGFESYHAALSGLQHKVICTSSVLNLNQVQTLCRQSGTGETAIARLKKLQYFARCPASAPDFEQSSCDGPHHVLQKSIATDAKDPCVFGAVPRRLEYGARPILDFRPGGAKGCEVVRAQKVAASFIDRILIQGVAECINISTVERTDDWISPYLVLVCF